MRITKYTLDFEDSEQLRKLLEAVPVAKAKPSYHPLDLLSRLIYHILGYLPRPSGKEREKRG
jgi:hypothetical protein